VNSRGLERAHLGNTLIVYAGKYDGTTAGARRVRQLAMGLREAGDGACVISYHRGSRTTEDSISWMTDQWGVDHASVPVTDGSIRNPRVLWDALTVSSRLGDMATKALRQRGFDRVLLYGSSWTGLRAVVGRMHRAAVPMVADLNEWFLWDQRPLMVVLDQNLFRRFAAPRLAGIAGISVFWDDYARRLGKPVILIPALGDDEFEDLEAPSSDVFNLVYVGVLFRRDLPLTMIDGVRAAAQRGCKFRFIILGRPNLFPAATEALRQLQADPLLHNRVEITGWVERERLREVYREAGAFLLLRGNDWESRASFPTRLPEFLASGRPVITSMTGDAAFHLQHRQNAWLLPEGHEPERLADAICHLAVHREEATQIGRAGRVVARKEFCFRVHGQRLKEFLDRL
jgi:glycosyltransferase involved in cell wall biosynthesis